MSKFAQLQIKKAHDIDSTYIPHAFDPKLFFPLNEDKKLEIRKKWGLLNKFIVGVVARNQGRKMLDRTVKAFAIFCKDRPDAILLMHTDPNDGAQIFNLMTLINRLKIQNRVVFTGATFHNAFTYTQMNEVYNVMDVFLLTTSGEGFGVPIIEAMAVGIPQIVTDYTTTKELVIDDIKTGVAVSLVGTKETPHPHTDEILNGTMTGTWAVERGIMDLNDCVDKLNYFYEGKKTQLIKNCIEKAKGYTWKAIMPLWIKALKGLE